MVKQNFWLFGSTIILKGQRPNKVFNEKTDIILKFAISEEVSTGAIYYHLWPRLESVHLRTNVQPFKRRTWLNTTWSCC